MMLLHALTLAASVTPALGHFLLEWPIVRGFDEDQLVNYPCGGQSPSKSRTMFPTTNAPVQLQMHHRRADVQLLVAFGNNPTGDDFTTVVRSTFLEVGFGNFCLGGVTVPGAKDGMNATLLATTSGDDGAVGSGLYNCADITFTSNMLSSAAYSAHCVNGSGITTQSISNGASLNANGTAIDTGSASGMSGTSGMTTSTSAGFAMPQKTANAAIVAGLAGILGAAAVL